MQPNKTEFSWIRNNGRNRDGDIFQSEMLVYGDGRVMATIDYPQQDEKSYEVKVGWREHWARTYIDLDAAKRYSEEMAARSLEDEFCEEVQHNEWIAKQREKNTEPRASFCSPEGV